LMVWVWVWVWVWGWVWVKGSVWVWVWVQVLSSSRSHSHTLCSSNKESMMKIIVLHMTLKCFLIVVIMFSCHWSHECYK
jgi:hypothetical protein